MRWCSSKLPRAPATPERGIGSTPFYFLPLFFVWVLGGLPSLACNMLILGELGNTNNPLKCLNCAGSRRFWKKEGKNAALGVDKVEYTRYNKSVLSNEGHGTKPP